MTNEFNEMDAKWMKKTDALRNRKLPESFMRGFAESVEEKIRQKHGAPQVEWKPKFSWRWVPVAVPTLAMAVLATVVISRLYLLPEPAPRPATHAATLAAETTTVDEDIAILSEIGAWTEEDQSNMIQQDEDLSDLELSAVQGPLGGAA